MHPTFVPFFVFLIFSRICSKKRTFSISKALRHSHHTYNPKGKAVAHITLYPMQAHRQKNSHNQEHW